ncbi:MAG: hypothetical protein NZ902_03880 [Acidilobaceae archaeon]|nr:hypothetical protein [Acidilobaceae archaeon]MDW7974353.1 hypothetical protein [Sulfolobales archaeon]
MPLLVLAAEKTKEIDPVLVTEFLKAAAALRKPEGYRVSLVVYGERALPLIDPTDRWDLLPEAFDQVPFLGKSADLLEALREVREMVELEEEPWGTLILWSAAVRPRFKVELAFRFLQRMGVAYKLLVLRPSLPGWIKYHGELAGAVTYRNNMNVEKLYLKLAEELEVGRTEA